MKKNILTIIILALGVINMILTAVIVFAVVPTTVRTNKLITKVASSIDLELESKSDEEKAKEVDLADVEVYKIEGEKLIANLKPNVNDSDNHYASISASLSINTKSKDYKTLQPKVAENEGKIREIINNTVSNYSKEELTLNEDNLKDKIKEDILKEIQEYFKSDFIIGISLVYVTE